MTPDKPTQDEPGDGDWSSAHKAGHGSHTRVSLDELIAKGRTMVDRVESAVRRIADRIRRPG
jgi:hypothetical protein